MSFRVNNRNESGFTMIELVMVIVLLGIVAGVSSSVLFGNSTSISAGLMARKVLADVRYAQSLAMRRTNIATPDVSSPNFRFRIRFNVADVSCAYTNQYNIVNDADSNGTWGDNPNGGSVVESAREPDSGAEYFCIQLDTGKFAGLSVTVDFGGAEAGTLEFDNLGVPYNSDGVKLTTTSTITVAKGGASKTVLVTPHTGAARIQ